MEAPYTFRLRGVEKCSRLQRQELIACLGITEMQTADTGDERSIDFRSEIQRLEQQVIELHNQVAGETIYA